MKNEINFYEWYQITRKYYISVLSENSVDSIKRIILLSKYSLGVNIDNESLYWDSKNEEGYIYG